MTTSVTEFMLKLRKIEDAGLTTRDVLILWACRSKAGMMGREVQLMLAYPFRSMLQIRFRILSEKGLLEDRRLPNRVRQREPNRLYVTPAGEKFLDDLLA